MQKIVIGQRFNHLVVLSQAESKIEKSGNKRRQWLCKCDCGNTKIVTTDSLMRSNVKSCGCLKKISPNRTHQMSKTRLYTIWFFMRSRCNNPNKSSYKYYGGKGIKVCQEWDDVNNDAFLKFYNWSVSNGYKDGLSLDRIDVDKNYEPSNCRWVEWAEQQRNKTNNYLISFDGKTQTLAEWAREVEINETTIKNRLNRNWSVEDALTLKPKPLKRIPIS